ncbi:MAG: MBL fold metallo-hydrolase, partial [Armatimonadetes bacterium]|nr:MBL fold metallo-hydrolase [Armatimonadota bacterium]NIM23929.1 MBL fold metallo-hydrolase [Armatimonadota bacterium]NIM67776.1 MBL fold metallo-hydrolase [Armatimonadota bacterium]NIM76316.1 MBL fold metallo-hydrolase [Armatimonadota bacterium]NIN06010.1 MBL fold metallo-hydrolase [Armatimonadota bacterium]
MAPPSQSDSSPLQIVGIPLGPLQTNCYVVSHPDHKSALIVDPADTADVIISHLRDRNLEPGLVVLTHGHCDHIGAAAELAIEGVPLAIHPADADMLSNPEASGAFLFGVNEQSCQASRLLNEGDTIDLWEGAALLRVIHTPGHSPGSICLIGDGFALVGDLLFAGSMGRTDLYGGDDAAMMKSLR